MASELDDMISLLGLYLNEINQASDAPEEFNQKTRLKLLNIAQDKVCTLIHSDYLVGLHMVDEEKSLTSGAYALSGLTYDIFHKNLGVMGVKIFEGAFAEQINFQKYRQLTVDGRSYAATSPLFYFRGGSIYLLPTTTAKIDVYYMRKPYEMFFDVATGSIKVDAQYYVEDYTIVTYNSTVYNDGDTFTGVTGQTTYTTNTGSITAAATGNAGSKTIFTSASHGLAAGDSITITGCTEATYNASWTIDSATTDTFTIVVAFVADDTGTWTITGTGSVQCYCELDSEIRDIIVEYASYIGFKYGKDTARAKLAWDDSMTAIDTINAKIDPQYAARTKVSREAGLKEKSRVQRETLRAK